MEVGHNQISDVFIKMSTVERRLNKMNTSVSGQSREEWEKCYHKAKVV